MGATKSASRGRAVHGRPAGSGCTSFPLPDSPFARIDLGHALPVPALVIASENDEYCAPERSGEIASALGAGWISLGPVGHINADSGLGPWRQGRDLFTAFVSGFDRQQESPPTVRI